MRVIFLKDSYYRNKKYFTGQFAEMSEIDIKAYIDCKTVKLMNSVKKGLKKPVKANYENMSYRDLQRICKRKNITAVGKKEELISFLKAAEAETGAEKEPDVKPETEKEN